MPTRAEGVSGCTLRKPRALAIHKRLLFPSTGTGPPNFLQPRSVFTKQWLSNSGTHPSHLQGLLEPGLPAGTHPQGSELVGLGQSLRTCVSNRLSVLAQAPRWENRCPSDDPCNVLTTPPSPQPVLSACWMCGFCLLLWLQSPALDLSVQSNCLLLRVLPNLSFSKRNMTGLAHPFLSGQGRGYWKSHFLATFGPVGLGQGWQSPVLPDAWLEGSSSCRGHSRGQALPHGGGGGEGRAKALRQYRQWLQPLLY